MTWDELEILKAAAESLDLMIQTLAYQRQQMYPDLPDSPAIVKAKNALTGIEAMIKG